MAGFVVGKRERRTAGPPPAAKDDNKKQERMQKSQILRIRRSQKCAGNFAQDDYVGVEAEESNNCECNGNRYCVVPVTKI
jgi:hypothetical protein